MKWRKPNGYATLSDCGAYRVSKTMHSGTPLYTLWCGEKQVGMYDSMKTLNVAADHHKGAGR